MLAELRGRLEPAKFIFLADFQGLNTAKAAELRKRLRPSGARFQIVPNNLFRKAAAGTAPDFGKALEGPTAMVVGAGDAVEAAKTLVGFQKENQRPAIKAGALEGKVLTVPEIQALAALPARPVLLGQVVGTIAAPMTRLVGALQQKLASVVYVLKAVQSQKEKAAAA